MAETFKNQGNEHYAKGELELAAAYYQQAIETDPGYANAYNNLGAIHRRQNRPDEALVCYRKALALNPALAKAHYNLGSILAEKGDYAAAANAYKKAIETNPGYAEAHEGLGNVLKDLGQFDDAVASYLRALENKPDYAGAHNNLGIAFQDLGQLDDAVACFAQALKIKPDFAEAHSNLLLALNYVSRGSHLPSLEEALRFGRMVNNNTRTRFTVWPCKTIQPERLRVGLVSGDLLNHPVGYFLESLLPHIDPTRIELIAYSTNRKEDELTIRLKTCFTAWKPLVELSDEAAASAVHADGVHILIDLSGHTAYNRLPLFAWKPAPVQVSWLGYFATTGVEGMDYFIADPWTAPESEESHFTEKIQRLPETYLCFSPPNIKVQVASLPALTDGHITFGCFNNLTKMNDAVVALWARVLQAVPGSRLFLKTRQLGEAAVRQSVSSRFAAHGIAAERLMLEGAAPRAELLAAYRRVDIALDPFPYPGGATSIEALWMGVPVLTLAGDRFLSHIGESIMQNTGLPAWIAVNADDYVARAVSHAGDLQRLAILRNGLRQQVLASPLFDAPRFARHFETALREMWRKRCSQQQEQPSI
ncbi:MAG: tetratricopeptide repeat protein [Sulfuricellaceae bacterium]